FLSGAELIVFVFRHFLFESSNWTGLKDKHFLFESSNWTRNETGLVLKISISCLKAATRCEIKPGWLLE
ncbi:601_t:CDS:2, partial [Ambispora leptoticha]